MKMLLSFGKVIIPRWRRFVCLILWILFSGSTVGQSVKVETFSDGVRHYYRAPLPDDRPRLFVEVEKLFDVVLSERKKLPFGKSVAFLVGVSNYNYIHPQLPFVENDLTDMRKFLLDKGGFDEVYVIKNEAVNRDLIEDYIQNKFFPPLGISHPLKLSQNDRFLFYYSGHGGDKGGRTGYMQFSKARPGNFAGNQVLQMKTFQTWCSEIKVDHLLFIFDCCNSGLGFNPSPRSDNSFEQLIATLSRNGSRTIITAGTANEKTFEVKDSRGRGNGVFTRAFLNALENGRADSGRDGFITIDEIMARVKSEIAEFSSRYNQSVTPRDWQLDVNNYRGTFVFINPAADQQNITLGNEILAITGARSAQPIEGEIIGGVGTIQLTSEISGEVYIDGRPAGRIDKGQVIAYRNQPVGDYEIEVRSTQKQERRQVTVKIGQVVRVSIAATGETGTTIPAETAITAPLFRSIPNSNFTPSDRKAMLNKYGFFDSYDNPGGKGFDNDYEAQTLQGGKVVIDRASGLMWQQSGSSKFISHTEAKKYVEQLNRDHFAGYGDWRLPTLEETMSLMESEKNGNGLYIDRKFDKTLTLFWTADTYSASNAWLVDFLGGHCGHVGVVFNNPSARAVRSR